MLQKQNMKNPKPQRYSEEYAAHTAEHLAHDIC